jgi:hypothetical protein
VNIESIEMIPSARRLMESLRDIGYDLPAAVADLVDNSLDARAEHVYVDLEHDRDGGWIRIADDGRGMTERQLDEAMRYGSSRDYDGGDLGHFGLGLKTASLSQCRRLTVATRSTLKGSVRVRRWDLDHVARTDAWSLERPLARDCRDELIEPLVGSTGTVVLWEKLDRVIGTRRLGGDAAARRLEQVAEELAEHLAMVFHRFIGDDAPGTPLSLRLQGSELSAWDPFARDEPLTLVLPLQRLALEHAGTKHAVVVQPYLLPAQQHFSSPAAHAAAAGPRRWNRQQGLYVYRRDRLIQSGGWSRLRTLDEHAKLARVAVDIPTQADDAFRTNVAKMSVGLPDTLRPPLRALVAGVVSRAQDAYRSRMRLVPDTAGAKSGGFGLSVADQWPQVTEALEGVLGHDAQLLDRALVALANVRPAGAPPVVSGADAEAG